MLDERSQTRKTIWSHSHGNLEQAKLIHGGRKQTSGCLELGQVKGLTGTGRITE